MQKYTTAMFAQKFPHKRKPTKNHQKKLQKLVNPQQSGQEQVKAEQHEKMFDLMTRQDQGSFNERIIQFQQNVMIK